MPNDEKVGRAENGLIFLCNWEFFSLHKHASRERVCKKYKLKGYDLAIFL